MKDGYKEDKITAKDIFLPPFKDGLNDAQIHKIRYNYIQQVIEEEKQLLSSVESAAIERQKAA